MEGKRRERKGKGRGGREERKGEGGKKEALSLRLAT